MAQQEEQGGRAARRARLSGQWLPAGRTPNARVTHVWVGLLGVLFVVVGVLMFIGSIGSLLSGDMAGTDPPTMIGLAAFFALAAAGGVWMFLDNLWHPNRTSAADLDQRLLALAASSDGSLTVDDVAVALRLTPAKSKEALDRQVMARQAEMKVTENGTLVYAFPGVLSPEQKRGARPL